VDTYVDLTWDANFCITQGGVQTLSTAAGEPFKIASSSPQSRGSAMASDGKQRARETVQQLLITLMEVSLMLFISFNSLLREMYVALEIGWNCEFHFTAST
jgi:hypothetical protein